MSWIARYRFRQPRLSRSARVSNGLKLHFDYLEDRIEPAPFPVVSLSTDVNPFIGQQNLPVAVTFTNPTPAATQPGFGPWTYVVLPASGADGAPINDGVSYAGGATFLGAPITGTVLTSTGSSLTASGAAAAYALNGSGNPITINGLNNGDQVVFFQLPYISFATDQPNATVNFNVNVSNKANLNAPLNLTAGGGFTLGADALNNPGTDAPLLAATQTTAVTPELVKIKKTYIGPEQETATGPNYVRQYRVDAFVAPGQTITNFQLKDSLDIGMQFVPTVPVTGTVNGGSFIGLNVLTSATAAQPGGTIIGDYSQVVGDASASSADASMTFSFFVPRVDQNNATVLPLSTGAFRNLTDTAESAGFWTPIDPTDPAITSSDLYWTNPARQPTDTITAKSIAVQKGVTVVSGLAQQGATLQYTINFQVSDYFAMDQLNIPDVLPNGVRFDNSFTPTLTVTNADGTTTTYTGSFLPANYTVGSVDATNGTQPLNFNISSQIGGAGRLVGGWIPTGGTGSPGNLPDPSTFGNSLSVTRGPAAGVITFQAKIQNTYDFPLTAPNDNVKQGDTLTNTVPTTTPAALTVSPAGGRILAYSDASSTTGSQQADGSGASVTIRTGTITKTIYAINDNTTVPATPILQAGDKVTYRLTYVLPTSSAQDFRLNDFLPLPVYDATQVSTANFGASRGTIPAAGEATYGPGVAAPPTGVTLPGGAVDYGTLAGQSDPTLSSNATANTLQFTFPVILQDPNQRASFVDVLFSVTILDRPYADGFPLTNQANAREGNTPDTPTQSDIINQVLLGRPELNVTKGVVATTRTGTGPFGNGGGTFGGVGAANSFTGTINSNGLGGSAINSNLNGIDAGDAVQFAVAVENKGTGPHGAFDVVINDTVPTGFSAQTLAGGLNLQIRDGTGTGGDVATAIGAGYLFFDTLGASLTTQSAVEAAFFGTGLRISGTGPTTGTVTQDSGVIDAYNATSGRNILVITYDLRAEDSTQANPIVAGQTLTNTSSVLSYFNQPGGTNQTGSNVGSLTDTATVNALSPTLAKTLTGTSVTNTGNNGATQATIGETATYTLVITVPDGVTNNFVVTDNLPSGLAFVSVTSVTTGSALTLQNTISNGATPSNTTITNSGSTVSFNFGMVANANNLSTGTDTNNTITIVYDVVVLNKGTASPRAGNVRGTSLINSAQGTFDITGGATGSTNLAQAVPIVVVEPRVNLQKSYALSGNSSVTGNGTSNGVAQAGNTIIYTVTLTNPVLSGTNTTRAYNVTLNDPLPSSSVSFSSVITYASGPGRFTASDFVITSNTLQTVSPLAFLDPGETITLTITGTVLGAVNPNQSVGNTATDTWTSFPAPFAAVSNYNANSVERTGDPTDPGQLNDYKNTATATFKILVPQPVKSLVTTSEGSTTGKNVAPGEVATYRLAVSIPRSTLPNYQLIDTLASGLSLIPGTARLIFVSSSGTLVTSSTISGANLGQTGAPGANSPLNATNSLLLGAGAISVSGTQVTFSLGDLTNAAPDTDAGPEQVILEFQAVTLNVVGNTGGTNSGRTGPVTTLNNTFVVDVNGSQSGPTSNTITVILVEPNVTTNKTVAVNGGATGSTVSGDAGDPVVYTITLNNVGNATAFNTLISDLIPAEIGATTAGGLPTISVIGGGIVASDLTFSGRTLVTSNAAGISIAAGTTVVITLTGVLTQAVAPTQSIGNTVNISYTSLPGTNGTGNATPGNAGDTTGERTGGTGTGSNGYTGTASATVVIPNLTVSKSLVGTSLADTSGNNLAIGETATYGLTVNLPEGTTTNLVLTDVLPVGTVFVAGSVVVDTTGFNGTVTSTPTVNYDAPSRTLTITFTTVTVTADNVTGNNPFTVNYDARVRDVGSNQAQTIPHTSLTNTFTAQAGTSPLVTSNPVTTTVVEPALQATKTLLNADTTVDAGTVMNYSITITHTAASSGPAYNIVVSDLLNSLGLAINAASVALAVGAPGYVTLTNNSVANGNLNAVLNELKLGDSVTINFSATLNGPGLGNLTGNTVPAPGSTVTNTASVTFDTAPSGTPESRTEPGVGTNPTAFTVNTYSLAGYTYYDANNNGIKDVTETLITGQTVAYELIGTDSQGNTVTLNTSSSDGAYRFANLRPGTYRVVQINQPVGYIDGKDTSAGVGIGFATPFGGTGDSPSRTGKTDATLGAVTGGITAITIPLNAAQDGFANVGINYGFGELLTASLGDLVWDDINGNGVQNNVNQVGGEPGINGITVTLTGTDDIGVITPIVTTTSGTGLSTGSYLFNNLRPGNYVVTFGNTAGGKTYNFTVPNSSLGTTATDSNADASGVTPAVMLVSGQTDLTIDAGVYVPVTVGDTVFYDTNADGIQNNGELGIPNVSLTLTGTDGAGNPINRTLSTDASGNYQFMGLPPGSYTVTVTPPVGASVNTTPLVQTTTPSFLTSGGSDLNLDFGFHGVGTVGSRIFLDQNNNGMFDTGEGISGVTVTLTGDLNGDGQISAGETLTTVTTTDGLYSFTNLRTSDSGVPYTVTVNTTTLPQNGLGGPLTNTVDPDGGNNSTSITSLSIAAPNNLVQNFGYQGPGQIGSIIFHDTGTGVPGPNDGITGVTVTLTADIDGTGPKTFTTVTDANGKYLFNYLPITKSDGTPVSYTVKVDPTTLPAGLINSADPDGVKDSQTVTILSGNAPTKLNDDFGYMFQGGTIGSRVFLDQNNNGLFDAGEGLVGVTVTLLGDITGDGIPEQFQTVTGPDGFYQFTGLPFFAPNGRTPVQYTVKVTTGVAPSLTNTVDPDNVFDASTNVVLTPAAPTSLNDNFGYRGPGSIGDTVYFDYNGDGVQGVGEPGISGAKVTVTWYGPDGLLGGGDDLSFSTVTDASGKYSVANLPTGNYQVNVDSTTLPPGFVPVSDLDGIATANSALLSLTTAVPNRVDADFGYRGTGSLGDRVWLDFNSDGIQDANEPGVPGATITTTWAGQDGILGTADDGTFTTVTGANGIYSFPNLPPGSYQVAITGGLPPGTVPTYDLDGGKDNKAVAALANGQNRTDVDFGIRGTSNISGSVYRDDNNNGVREPGEPGFPGVTVILTGTDILGNPINVSTVTDANGNYTFPGLLAGNYTISQVTQPPDTTPGITSAGNVNGVTVGVPQTKIISQVTLGTGVSAVANDFAQLMGSVAGTVYVDANRNGTFDTGEQVLPGEKIDLIDSNGVVIRSTTTDANGNYIMRGFPPGNYTVRVTQPNGYSNSTPTTLSVNVPPLGLTDLNFGEQTGTVSGYVYRDLSVDGIRANAPGETGIGGTTVTLTGTDVRGNQIRLTTTTDSNGKYVFTGLLQGNYTVNETRPAGFYYKGLDTAGNFGGTVTTSQIVMALPAGADGIEYNFGENPPADPFGFVYVDLNQNGVKDPGEPGIPNVAITISGTAFAGTQLAHTLTAADLPTRSLTVTTDSSGHWEIPIMPPGFYTIVEPVQPAGYLDGAEQNADPNAPAPTVGNDRFDNIVLNPSPIRGAFNFGELLSDPTKRNFLSSTPPFTPITSIRDNVPLTPQFSVTTGTPGKPDYVVSGTGVGTSALIRVFDYATGGEKFRFSPYESSYTGGVRVATGDVNGDGTPDILAATGIGGGPRIRIYSGTDGSVIRDFFAYEDSFRGGVFVASGDVNGDGKADIATGVDTGGGPRVRVFDGATGAILADFFAFDANQRGGVRVALGDVNGDGKAEIIATPGTGVTTRVRVFDLAGNVLQDYMPYSSNFTGGVQITAGDFNGDGAADVITAADVGGGPHVQVFDGKTGKVLAGYFAYESSFTGGVRLAAHDVNGDGKVEIITAPGIGGAPRVRVLSGTTPTSIDDFYNADPSYTGGVYVG